VSHTAYMTTHDHSCESPEIINGTRMLLTFEEARAVDGRERSCGALIV